MDCKTASWPSLLAFHPILSDTKTIEIYIIIILGIAKTLGAGLNSFFLQKGTTTPKDHGPSLEKEVSYDMPHFFEPGFHEILDPLPVG